MAKIKLSDFDRDFFTLVADAAFTNPFSARRTEIDLQIVRLATGEEDRSLTWPEIVPLVVKTVGKRLEEMECKTEQKMTLNCFGERDKTIMKYVFLFDIFHQAAQNFDSHIRRQEKGSDRPLTVSFAPDVLGQLHKRGFTEQEAVRYFALFYQIRRAFYFILHGLVGPSDCMRSLRMALWNNIFTDDIRNYEQYLWDRMEDFATLIEGPTGSGKGAAAAAISKSIFIPFDPSTNTFQNSFMDLFVAANISQFSPTLLESELFGHIKGAFTGAVTEQDGLLGQCQPHGTIFLDEIGEISPQVQVKLLKVLEERVYCPVGSQKLRRFHGRVIAATNRPLSQLRREGIFREDFYYRLCADCIQMPGLAQRVQENPEELVELVSHFIRQITGQDVPALQKKVMEVIETRLGPHYDWPGNVRELTQCIRRVILRQDYQPQRIVSSNLTTKLFESIERGECTAEQLLTQYCKWLHQKYQSYQEVARISGLNWRTAKKRVDGE